MFECADRLRTIGKVYHLKSSISIGTAVLSRPNGLALSCAASIDQDSDWAGSGFKMVTILGPHSGVSSIQPSQQAVAPHQRTPLREEFSGAPCWAAFGG